MVLMGFGSKPKVFKFGFLDVFVGGFSVSFSWCLLVF